MKQISIREQDEFIKLGQALKKADLVRLSFREEKSFTTEMFSHMTAKQLRLLNNDY